MAKQRGTHQISGTINNLVYYQQKYVRGGLIRRQNEAMSNRLKEDPIFNNTRDANALFGGCMMLSSALLSFGTRRLVVMTRPSRNANLTASLLRMYQAVNGSDKGAAIDISQFSAASLLEATDRIMKTPVSRFFNDIGRYYKNVIVGSDIDVDFTAESLTRYAELCKVNRLQIEFFGPAFISTSEKDATSKKFLAPEVYANRVVDTHTWNIGDGDLSVTLSAVINTAPRGFLFCSILPVVSGVGMLARFKIQNAIGFYMVLDYQKQT